jgi:hypothetical protein
VPDCRERLSVDESYVRPTPRFETSDERYSWLSGLVVVGYGEYGDGRIDHRGVPDSLAAATSLRYTRDVHAH